MPNPRHHALATFSNGIRNVPSTAAAAKSKELKPDPNFATFTKVFVREPSDGPGDAAPVRPTSRPSTSFLAEVAGREGEGSAQAFWRSTSRSTRR